MDIDILTLFPEFFDSPLSCSMLKRARQMELLRIGAVNIRDFATDKHKSVDDRPYGGGPGMVLKPEPTIQAIRSVRRENSHVICMSPQGRVLKAKDCERYAKEFEHIVILCGHYEGLDQRILDLEVDEEVSIGDFVLTSGMPAALVFIDAVSRFIPGVIGHPEAMYEDSFHREDGVFDGPHYTRPPEFENLTVPAVLMGGNHRDIADWRKKEASSKQKRVRPELTNYRE
ncbi:MAG: tRNA (guanosine(37)-N1)-methyltransferase TrmD [Verrucomicrobia bacterium]|nr:tRNA (guanosine(37)-N1)-methyltransferase TrmD [Verrucomicrobiota bacterium]